MRIATILLAALLAAPAAAQEARIGLQTETSSIDPHFALVGANQTIARHIFEPLLGADGAMRPAPGLTTARQVAPDLWEFTIREGARFHDGTPLTSEDIRFSLERMPRVPNSPAPFIRLAGVTQAIEVVDARTIRIRTRGFDPSVPLHAMSAWIVSARAAEGAASSDFNAGRATIGSGPWRFVEFSPGSRIVLERNAQHPAPPAFARVTLRPIASDAARLAALLAGDVDLIDAVPPADLQRLASRPEIRLARSRSARMIYLGLDQGNDVSPFLEARGGGRLDRNPLRDVRVREALSIAIQRDAIVERVLSGAAAPAAQLVPAGFIGHEPALSPPRFELDRARRLLAEAGFPQGFRITLHSPNNRYVEDDKTVQAIAQMWTRAGLETRVEVMPANVFFTRAGRREFSAFLIGFNSTAGDAYPALSQVLHSFDQQRGLGGLNRGRYSNPAFDALLARSNAATDAAERDGLLREATRLGFATDHAIIPLHFPENIWAMRSGFEYRATVEESTLAQNLRPR
jgi:peptide/nickel transport system substrate-binding protein